jgi:hypothetical protein
MNEQAGARTGREKAEVVAIRWRGDRDETLDLGTTHKQLHRDPCAERDARDPAGACGRIGGLRPIERGGGVRKFSGAVIERPKAATYAAEIEAKHGEPALGEGVIEVVDDLIVHRAAELRVRMQDERDRRPVRRGLVEAAFQPAGGTDEENLWHGPP